MPLLQTLQSAMTAIPMVESFFLNPLGFLGLLALLPLAIFYLVKPKPEEQLMPSMRFFHESEGRSQLRSAIKTILRNLTLLIQIFILIGFAVALAKPFSTTFQHPENSVIIFDRSASMQNDFQDAKKFAESRLGEKNTLIVVDSDIQVKAEKAQPAKTKEILDQIKPVDTETNLASAIDAAREYRGRLVIASDLDQTTDSRDISQILTSVSSRPLDIFESHEGNSWGITGLEIGRNSTQVEVTGFRENSTLEVRKNQKARKISLQDGETVKLTFQNNKGRNTVKLPEDEMKADNRAYYVVPDSGERKIRYLGPGNRYFSKAVKLASGLSKVGESGEKPDIYVIGGKLKQKKLEEIASKVKKGASTVVFKESRAMKKAFGFDTSHSTKNVSATINYPQRIDIGQTQILERGIDSGKSLSNPESAVKIYSYGKGKILAYNIEDRDFRYSFMYPVFWKSALERISNTPTINELNRETGETLDKLKVQSPGSKRHEGKIELNTTGFYTSGNTAYAVNLLSRDESSPDGEKYSSPNQKNLQKSKESVQSLAILLIMVLISTEIGYLWYRGDL